MNETPDVKKKNGVSYFCPWMATMTSSICPQGLCRFWSIVRHDCRWNHWLEREIFKTDLIDSKNIKGG